MSQRLDNKKWLWCLLALHVGSVWGTARPITVRPPPSNPSTIEAQAKFFQDFFSVQLSPYKIEFGHVCEDPNTWEQRYEKKDFKNHRDMGKVRWGDKKGGYGEHYWDLNHAGNADNIGDDGDDGSYRESHDNDGSYRSHDNDGSYRSHDNDPYDEPSNSAPTYGEEEYDPERSSYEESGRAKRAHPKVERTRKSERKHPKLVQTESVEESAPKKQNHNRASNNREPEVAETSQEEEFEDEEEEEQEEEKYEKPKPKRQHYRKKEDDAKPKEKNQVVLVVSHKDDEEQPHQIKFTPTSQPDHSSYLNQQQPPRDLTQYLPQTQQLPQQLPQYLPQHPQVPKQHLEPPHFVPYEGGAGVRQHHQPDVTAASTVPRLFLEPSTGHVVDRATGQAYVLQPIAPHNNYN